MSERNDPPREADEPAAAVARVADEPGTAVEAGHGGGVAIRDDDGATTGDNSPTGPPSSANGTPASSAQAASVGAVGSAGSVGSASSGPGEPSGHPDDAEDPDTHPAAAPDADADADPDAEDPRHLPPPTPDDRPHAAATPGKDAPEKGASGKDTSGKGAQGKDAEGPVGDGKLVGAAEHLVERERRRAESRSRRAAGAALALVGGVILAVAGFTTPWRVLAAPAPAVAPDPARDFSAAQIARSQAFDAATSLPGYLSLGLTVLFAGLLVLTPFSAKVLGVLRGPWWLRVVLGVVVLTAITEALRWPLGMWFETIMRDYGLSTQDWAGWTADRLKNTGVSVVLLAIMLLALVALARKVRRWWIPAAVGAFALTVGVSYVYPVVFEPLFNDFTSMPQGTLRTELLAMAERDGVPVEDVLVADASRRTTALNAYVSGFGATRRIVVYDTLLKAPESEVELVVAHELGHAKHADVLDGTLLGGLLAGFGAIGLFLLVGPLRRRTGIASVADPRAVGVLMGVMTLASLVSDPAQNLITRHVEARADVHALDLTRDPATFVAMQKRLAITNISDLSPDAVEYVLYASHPSSPERIAMARSWARLNGVPEP
ncbi:M48 family metallopeptidase [Nonomuraea sp. WAC 01424]|uniref:M48 family metallopeptidase n=1 Tax=Nonomuraea sp. WAC 01424 TaxID=2203200 RepID=UPI00163BC042|nr:M48 family metallopeptidase [Nonomuraea sp. WAC 01424]